MRTSWILISLLQLAAGGPKHPDEVLLGVYGCPSQSVAQAPLVFPVHLLNTYPGASYLVNVLVEKLDHSPETSVHNYYDANFTAVDTSFSFVAQLPPVVTKGKATCHLSVYDSHPDLPHDERLLASVTMALQVVSEEWMEDPTEFLRSYVPQFSDVLRDSMGPEGHQPFRNCETADVGNNGLQGGSSSFAFPVAVMNLPHRADRRRHTEDLLPKFGLSNLSFPPNIDPRSVDVAKLIERGVTATPWIEEVKKHKAKGDGSVRSYLAHNMRVIKVLEQCIENGYEYCAIFEDDLMPYHGDVAASTEIIKQALKELPATADALFLEGCFMNCDKAKYSILRPHLMWIHSGFCAGAIIYTRKGAEVMRKAMDPIFHGFDDMFNALVSQGNLEAYATRPPIFYQDGYWGTDFNRSVQYIHSAKHQIVHPFCQEIFEAEMTQEGSVVKLENLPDWAAFELDRRLSISPRELHDELMFVLLPEDPGKSRTHSHWQVNQGWRVDYFTIPSEGQPGLIKIGEWSNTTLHLYEESELSDPSHNPVLLVLGRDCHCWHTVPLYPLCAIKAFRHNDRGELIQEVTRYIYLKYGDA